MIFSEAEITNIAIPLIGYRWTCPCKTLLKNSYDISSATAKRNQKAQITRCGSMSAIGAEAVSE